MTLNSLRGMLLVAVSVAALTGCNSGGAAVDVSPALTTANATIASLTADLATANATIASKTADLATANATIASKNAEIATKTAQIASLQGDKTALEADVASLQSDVADLEAEVADLEADITDLEADVASLEADKADLQSQLDNYNKTAYNANRDKTSYQSGGYRRAAGDLVQTNNLASSIDSKRQTVAYYSDVANDATAVVTDATIAAQNAQVAYSDASAFTVNPTYDGGTIAAYQAYSSSDATFYAQVLGLDLTDPTVQSQLVDSGAYLNAVADLLAAWNVALTDLNTAQNDEFLAQSNLTTAQGDLDIAIANYHADRAPQQASPLVLYQADGSAVQAAGAMVYQQSMTDTDTSNGDPLKEAGRLTALFLLDAAGDPTNVLVFEASMLGESSEANPFSLPAGAATFESNSMVAAFAQLEGGEDGVNTYQLQGATDAGYLTINFGDNTGKLIISGLYNGNSANVDFAVNADLTFDPATGVFNADGGVTQSYTSNTTGSSEDAQGTLTGALNAVADAFTAYIDTTDVTGINAVDVKIMTRIVGTGAYTVSP